MTLTTIKACEQCGQEVTSRDKKARFCSRACHYAWRSEHSTGENHWAYQGMVERTCEECGETFEVRKARARADATRFCSRACYGRWRSKHQCGKDSPSWRRIEQTCIGCGKTFYAQPNQVERITGDGMYCSRECRRKRMEKVCGWCGGSFEIQVCQERWGMGKFCSKKCYSAWQSKNIVGENHPNWRGGPELYPPGWAVRFKESIRDRDGRKCALCGVPENGRRHDVHHIDYVKENIDPSNLITLCRSCHTKTNFNRDYWQGQLAAPIFAQLETR